MNDVTTAAASMAPTYLCPNCGRGELLVIETVRGVSVTFYGPYGLVAQVHDQGECEGDTDDPVTCGACSFEGTVADLLDNPALDELRHMRARYENEPDQDW